MSNLKLGIVCLLIISSFISFAQVSDDEIKNDSILKWIEYARNNDLEVQKRTYFIDKAYSTALKEKNDSLKNNYFLKIAYTYYWLKDSIGFRKSNAKSINLSIKLRDSVKLAANYWDLGNFYDLKGVKDSAYYSYSKAEKLYSSLKKSYYQGLMFLNMAIIQSDLRDYTGSEVTTIKAIELLKPLEKDRQLYKCYNNLGIIYNELQEYDKALFYHGKALEYQKEVKGDHVLRENSLNNIGVVYKNNNEHKKAIEYYQKGLKNKDLRSYDAELYSMLLDNLAYSKLKINDSVGVKELLYESLELRDSIGFISGQAVSNLHLAEFHAVYKDTVTALQFAEEGKRIAGKSKNHRDLLASLLLLSKLDKDKSNLYLKQYIYLSEELLKEERAIRNKFTRIRFETDEFIEENELLTVQKKRILIIGSTLLLLSILLYIIRDQRVKNVRLRLEKEQQKANEEIYNLMLVQQNKLNEGKRKEKKRISEELHDGVLGNLYGIKMNLAVLNQQNSTEAISKREQFIENLSEVIDEIRNVSHELHANAIDADVGYIQLVENLLLEKSEIHGYDYEFFANTDTNWSEIRGDIKMNIYRILQEAVQNINKYAKAKNIRVSLASDTDFIHLTIIDDGVGFNTNTQKEGIGIKNIKSRTERLRGTVEFISELKKGTSIIIKIPYQRI